MKKFFYAFLLMIGSAVMLQALSIETAQVSKKPNVVILATGGTIAELIDLRSKRLVILRVL